MAYPKLSVKTMMGPVRPNALLLDNIDELPASPGEMAESWLHGASWNPIGAFDPIVATPDTCTPADFSTLANGRGCQQAVSQVAFQMFDAFSDTLMRFGPDATDEFDQVLLARFAQWQSWAFARALVGTAPVTSARTLSSVAAAPAGVPFGSPATPLANALAILETHLARKIQNGQGLLHIAPGLLAKAVIEYGVYREGTRWLTPLGNVVIADGGYADALPPAGQSAGTAAEWVYSSGPVWYRASGAELVGDAWQSIDITRDAVKRWLDSYGILVFDPAPVAAVLASFASE